MSSEACGTSESRECRLDRLIARFLQAEEAAEGIDPSTLLQQHPDLRDEFLSFLQHHQRLRQHFAAERPAEPAPTLSGQKIISALAQTTPPDHAKPMEAGQPLGNCFLLRELGRGGMGIVYLGRHRRLDCLRAIKILPRDQITDTTIERFRREAQTAASINHPNVVTIHDAGHEGEVHFIEMQYVEGETLREFLHRHIAQGSETPFPWLTAVKLLLPVLDGLSAVHARGLIHRDIKPSNIMVGERTAGLREPRVLLMDFGLVRDDSVDRLTETGLVVGTPAFMSPEQARGQKVDGRTDLYAIGATLYYLLAGRPPFEGPRPQVFWKAMSGNRPPPLQQRRPDIPGELVQIVDRAMSPEREQRFSRADELFEVLSAVAAPLAARVSVAVPAVSDSPKVLASFGSSAPAFPSGESDTVATVGVSSDTFDLPDANAGDSIPVTASFSAGPSPGARREHDFTPQLSSGNHSATGAADTLTQLVPLRSLGVAGNTDDLPHKLTRWFPVLGILAVATLVGLATFLLRGPSPPVKTRGSPAGPPASVPGELPGMVYIPPGQAWLGASETRLRQHAMTLENLTNTPGLVQQFVDLGRRETHQQVSVDGFWIDQYEVTNSQYAEFVRASGYPAPEHWQGQTPPPGSANHPVAGIRYRDAEAYAKWAGKKLPTIAQWSRAFRGNDDRMYPWGDTWYSDRANEYLNPGFDGQTSLVDATPRDVSSFGVFNLVGNVSEIVRERANSSGQMATIIKGASAMSQGDVFGAAPIQLAIVPEDFTSEHIGFRCVFEKR